MLGKYKLLKVFNAIIIANAIIIQSIPVKAQDIVSSTDITAGSSVFVFRGSRKKPQAKMSATRLAFSAAAGQRNGFRRKLNTRIAAKSVRKTNQTAPGKTVLAKNRASRKNT